LAKFYVIALKWWNRLPDCSVVHRQDACATKKPFFRLRAIILIGRAKSEM
jgi:hypothetical protein